MKLVVSREIKPPWLSPNSGPPAIFSLRSEWILPRGHIICDNFFSRSKCRIQTNRTSINGWEIWRSNLLFRFPLYSFIWYAAVLYVSSLFATQFFCFQDPISKPTILESKTCMLGLGKGRISKKSFFRYIDYSSLSYQVDNQTLRLFWLKMNVT